MLEWEEGTFLGLKALYQRTFTKPKERKAAAVRAHLKHRRQQLFLLAQMMAGHPVLLFETTEPILCDHEHIFLPPEISKSSCTEANAACYELKVIIGGLALRHHWTCDSSEALRAHLDKEAENLPNLAERIETIVATFDDPEDFWNLIGTPRHNTLPEDNSALLPADEHEHEDSDDSDQPTTEIEGQGQTGVDVEIEEGDDGPGSEMPIHTFEKAETLEEHSGLSRKRDGDDELEDHEEALKHLNMSHVLRSRDRPNSIYRADVLLNSVLLEVDAKPPAGGIPYPEWDYKKRRYKEDWCWVVESDPVDGNPEWVDATEQKHHALILDLKKKFAHLANNWTRTKRQPAGEEFDIDAVVEHQVTWRSGHTPSEDIYLDRHRDLHDVSALILLDRSYSTDGWVDGRRVLDIIRETIFCTGEVLEDFIDQFAIAAFSSDTRKRCGFDWIKSFDDPWHSSRSRLGSLQAAGYTRIGPALRHSQEILAQQSSERRVVILVTDGRPCDYDRYEGTYGIRDVKCAIETGRNHNITTHAFAVESRAREFFPAMFTPSHYHVVPDPTALTDSLVDLFATLKIK